MFRDRAWVMQRVLGAQGIRDEIVAEFLKHAPWGACPCRVGCFNCCLLLPVAAQFEGFIIAAKLLEYGWDHRLREIIRQGDAQQELLDEAGFPDSPTSVHRASAAWLARKEPCAFLHNGECVVYDVRPVACSTYFAQDAAQCVPEPGRVVTALDNTNPQLQCTALNVGFCSELCEQPLHVILGQVPLGQAVKVGYKVLRDDLGLVRFRRQLAQAGAFA